MKQVLIINGHPDKESYNYALSDAYRKGASKTSATLAQINIADLDFDPNLKFGYRKRMELELDLVDAIDKIKKAPYRLDIPDVVVRLSGDDERLCRPYVSSRNYLLTR